MKRFLSLLLALVLLTGAAASDQMLSRQSASQQREGSIEGPAAVYAAMLGQFRTVAANLLWIKADDYHHEFLETNPHWSKNEEILPLMRMITWLDPNFVQAYTAGSWMLGIYMEKPEQGMEFLEEGIRNNPNSVEMFETKALMVWRTRGDIRAALKELKKAESLADNRFDKDRLGESIRTVEAQIASGREVKPIQTRKLKQ